MSEVKERPIVFSALTGKPSQRVSEKAILFSAPMVIALLNGTKTQTRRVVKLPRWAEPEVEIEEYTDGLYAIAKATGCLAPIPCPYGKPGERLWVRETWQSHVIYAADHPWSEHVSRWRNALFMPRRASRITLEITDVRARLDENRFVWELTFKRVDERRQV